MQLPENTTEARILRCRFDQLIRRYNIEYPLYFRKMRCVTAAAFAYLATTCAIAAARSGRSDHDHDAHANVEGHHREQAAIYDMGTGTSREVNVPGGESRTFEDKHLASMTVPAASAGKKGLEGGDETAEAGEISVTDCTDCAVEQCRTISCEIFVRYYNSFVAECPGVYFVDWVASIIGYWSPGFEIG